MFNPFAGRGPTTGPRFITPGLADEDIPKAEGIRQQLLLERILTTPDDDRDTKTALGYEDEMIDYIKPILGDILTAIPVAPVIEDPDPGEEALVAHNLARAVAFGDPVPLARETSPLEILEEKLESGEIPPDERISGFIEHLKVLAERMNPDNPEEERRLLHYLTISPNLRETMIRIILRESRRAREA